MKPAPFTYHDPRTIPDLVGLLGTLENVRLLAGGQSLVPMLNMRYAVPDHVIDLNRIPDLAGVTENGDGLRIGAMTRQRTLERDPLVRAKAPVLAEALRFVGHVQTRSRGTIGGSLCHLDPAAELPGIAALYDATLHATGPRGDRDIPMADWGVMYMTPALEPDEALVALTVPVWREPNGYAFLEFSPRHGDYAITAAAVLVALDHTRKVSRATIALVGVDVRPVRLAAAEQALAGAAPDLATLRAAAELAAGLDFLSDAHVTGEYRRKLAVTLTRRALEAAVARAQGQGHGRH
jgi:aerobic carbon-monoxide dehydrogenase medium subunit